MYYGKFPGPKYLLLLLVCIVVAFLMFGPGHQDADKYNANNPVASEEERYPF